MQVNLPSVPHTLRGQEALQIFDPELGVQVFRGEIGRQLFGPACEGLQYFPAACNESARIQERSSFDAGAFGMKELTQVN